MGVTSSPVTKGPRTAALLGFGAVKNSTAAPATSTPPPMKPIVEIVASVEALFPCSVLELEQPWKAGQLFLAADQSDEASSPNTVPTARPTTPPVATATAAIRCLFHVEVGVLRT